MVFTATITTQNGYCRTHIPALNETFTAGSVQASKNNAQLDLNAQFLGVSAKDPIPDTFMYYTRTGQVYRLTDIVELEPAQVYTSEVAFLNVQAPLLDLYA